MCTYYKSASSDDYFDTGDTGISLQNVSAPERCVLVHASVCSYVCIRIGIHAHVSVFVCVRVCTGIFALIYV